MATSPSSRAAALELLKSVLDRRQFLDEALLKNDGLKDLSGRDRAFTRLLVATTLRRLGQINALIEASLERPLPKKASDVTHILRLGATQLLFLKTPPHAAVDTGVRLTKEIALPAYAGLVNAVLRRFSRDGVALLEAQDAERLNTPDWLWKSWSSAYGEETTRKIAQAHMSNPPLDLSCRENPQDWAEQLGGVLLPTGSLRLHDYGHIPELSGFKEGAWWVQDLAASLPAKLLASGLGETPGEIKGKTVFDLCAAPGGKTAQLALWGANVIAVDRSQKRLATLKENLTRLHLSAQTVCEDAVTWLESPASGPMGRADAILIDAPCTATGTLRRHPDGTWLKSFKDVERCAALQDRLLKAALNALAPGGLLVFCTCSLQREEGPERISALMESGAPVERRGVTAAETGGLKELITKEGDLRCLPAHMAEQGGMDGFFACRLVKT